MTCQMAHLDGSYVLGALSPGERLDFERHLAGCVECSRSVRELAGLPGLLAQVDVRDLEPASGPPLPPTLLPSLVREVRGSQRRRSAIIAVVAGSVAATVAAVAVGALAVGGAFDAGEPTSTASASATAVAPRPTGQPMIAVAPTPVSADVLLSAVAWGTRLDLTCSYAADAGDYEPSSSREYALVVHTREGRDEQVATWRGLPGRTMHLSAATATIRSDIERVELRTAEGAVVLRLPL